MRRSVLIGACALGWFAAIGAGVWRQARYETAPGDAAATPAAWPGVAGVERAADRSLVVMALHPRCPCSRASVAEFEKVARGSEASAAFVVLVAVPEGADAKWTESDTVTAARGIPGVRVVLDAGGVNAAKLGMRSSGHVVVYDRAGALAFSGGITATRAQTGPNPGADALRDLASDCCSKDPNRPASTPVFGCALVGAPSDPEGAK